MVFALAEAAIGTSALLLLAMAAGVSSHMTIPGGLLQLALVIVLTVLCVCGLAVIIAARARSFSEGSLLTDAVGTGLVFLAPIYYTPEAMPQVLRLVSLVLPTTYAARGVRTTLAGGDAIGGDLLALAVLATVTLSIGFCVMRWREE
jgi:ABC-type multidrug transport system permease subunit